MWFFGLIIGAIIGAIGGVGGVVLGAMAGAGGGWALSQKLRGPGIERLEMLESAVRLLQQRVSSLRERTAYHGPWRFCAGCGWRIRRDGGARVRRR